MFETGNRPGFPLKGKGAFFKWAHDIRRALYNLLQVARPHLAKGVVTWPPGWRDVNLHKVWPWTSCAPIEALVAPCHGHHLIWAGQGHIAADKHLQSRQRIERTVRVPWLCTAVTVCQSLPVSAHNPCSFSQGQEFPCHTGIHTVPLCARAMLSGAPACLGSSIKHGRERLVLVAPCLHVLLHQAGEQANAFYLNNAAVLRTRR
jgi:hypothetical protein